MGFKAFFLRASMALGLALSGTLSAGFACDGAKASGGQGEAGKNAIHAESPRDCGKYKAKGAKAQGAGAPGAQAPGHVHADAGMQCDKAACPKGADCPKGPDCGNDCDCCNKAGFLKKGSGEAKASPPETGSPKAEGGAETKENVNLAG